MILVAEYGFSLHENVVTGTAEQTDRADEDE
jgi:hypothetical protein